LSSYLKKLGNQLLTSPALAYNVTAGLYLVSVLGIPTNWLSEIIIALVILRQGPSQGIKLAVISVFPLVLILAFFQQFLLIGFLCYMIFWLVVLSTTLRFTASWSHVVIVAGAVAVIHAVALQLYFPNIEQYWLHQLNSIEEQTKLFSNMAPIEKQQLFQIIVPYVTGFMLMMALLSKLVNLLLARLWQASVFNPGGLRQELLAIRMPLWVVACFIAIGVASLAWPGFFKDVYMAALLPFALAGLSLLHVVSQASSIGKILLIIFYVMLVILFFYMLNLLALVAVVDSWYDIRRYIKQ